MTARRWPRLAARWLWYWLPVLIWMALILSMSGQSDLPVRQNPRTGEVIKTTFTMAKIAHVVEYGVLALLLCRALAGSLAALRAAPAVVAIVAALAATAFGVADEWWQSFTPTREPRATDVLLDGTAAVVAAGCWWLWQRRLGRSMVSADNDRVAPPVRP